MNQIRVDHIRHLVTMNESKQEITDATLISQDREIVWVGPTSHLPPQYADQAGTVIDGRNLLVLPGMVNTHHHFYQTLTRAVPAAQNAKLFDWLRTHYPIWAEIGPEDVRVSTKLALVELLMSGCTTSSDHHYLWPNGSRLDDQFEAAEEVGVRFHGARGSMSLGESEGGLPPDSCTEDESTILHDSRRVVEVFHDPEPFSMQRVVLAPCSPFSVTPELMRESAALARSFGPDYDVHLHTHLAETKEEEQFCVKHFGYRPATFMSELGWTGDDVWHAHCVHLNQAEIDLFGGTSTGIAHCPTSNMRLASGIAPIPAMSRAGIPLGLGVDGSASNDGSHMLAEARQAMLLQRVQGDPSALTARATLEMATIGGARVLGRNDIGALAVGMSADFIAFDLNQLAYAGAAVHDPVATIVFCQPQTVALAIVNGRILVQDGMPAHIDIAQLVEEHNLAASQLLRRAGAM